jgi:hypothetical protein
MSWGRGLDGFTCRTRQRDCGGFPEKSTLLRGSERYTMKGIQAALAVFGVTVVLTVRH